MKVIIWKDKGPYVDAKLKLLPNVVYKIGEDISEEDANSILKDFGPHGMVEILNEDELKAEKEDNAIDNTEVKEDNTEGNKSIFEQE